LTKKNPYIDYKPNDPRPFWIC